jgi:uncharacterized protein YeeX (DUF496 family)
MGIPQIEVTFDVNADMIVSASAKDLRTLKEQNVTVKSLYGLNDTQIRIMREKLKSWLSERNTLEIKSQIDSLRNDVNEMLLKRQDALDWGDISSLREISATLSKFMGKRFSYKELEEAVASLRPIIENVRQKIVQYESVVKKVNDLMLKIETFSPTLKQLNEKQADLLNQGRDLLEDYLKHHLSCVELHKIFLSVRSGYEEAKAILIKQVLDDLQVSAEVEKWLLDVESKPVQLSSIYQYLSQLRLFEKAHLIRTLIKPEDTECQQSIQLKLIEKTKENPYLQSYFVLLISDFMELEIMPAIPIFPRDEKAVFLAFFLFDVLNQSKVSDHRRMAAEIIADNLPALQYFPAVHDAIACEMDKEVSKYLLKYLKK